MSSESTKYKITTEIVGTKVDDVNSFVVFRCPISHTSSFAILDISTKLGTYLVIEESIRSNQWLPVKVTIDIIEEYSKSDPTEDPKVKVTLCVKQYLAIDLIITEKPDISAYSITYGLLLVNPVLWFLQTTNSYNKILKNKSALDILKDYESHLKKTYGEKAFKFEKIGENKYKNDFKHEQLLIRVENDLLIPSWLIMNYKVFKSYVFYFFDDFKIDEDSEADITAILVNLADKTSFKRRDINDKKYAEILASNTFINNYSLTDQFNTLNQEKPSIVVQDNNFHFKFKKEEGKVQTINLKSSSSDAQIIQDRKVKAITTDTPQFKSKKPTEQTILFTTNKIDEATKMLEIVKKQIHADLKTIYEFYLKDSHPDFLQFGKLYNISQFEMTKYNYTPINIVNMFARDIGPVPLLVHNCHYQMIKFQGD